MDPRGSIRFQRVEHEVAEKAAGESGQRRGDGRFVARHAGYKRAPSHSVAVEFSGPVPCKFDGVFRRQRPAHGGRHLIRGLAGLSGQRIEEAPREEMDVSVGNAVFTQWGFHRVCSNW